MASATPSSPVFAFPLNGEVKKDLDRSLLDQHNRVNQHASSSDFAVLG